MYFAPIFCHPQTYTGWGASKTQVNSIFKWDCDCRMCEGQDVIRYRFHHQQNRSSKARRCPSTSSALSTSTHTTNTRRRVVRAAAGEDFKLPKWCVIQSVHTRAHAHTAQSPLACTLNLNVGHRCLTLSIYRDQCYKYLVEEKRMRSISPTDAKVQASTARRLTCAKHLINCSA